MTDQLDNLFLNAALSDEDLGYPDDVSFVPFEETWTDEVVQRNLNEGIASVLVIRDYEVMIRPSSTNLLGTWVDRIKGRHHVEVVWRPIGQHSPIAPLKTSVGRHPVRELVEA